MLNKYPFLTKLAGGIKDELIQINIGDTDSSGAAKHTTLKNVRRILARLAGKVNNKSLSSEQRNNIISRIKQIQDAVADENNYLPIKGVGGKLIPPAGASGRTTLRIGNLGSPLMGTDFVDSTIYGREVEPTLEPLARQLGFTSARQALDPYTSKKDGAAYLADVHEYLRPTTEIYINRKGLNKLKNTHLNLRPGIDFYRVSEVADALYPDSALKNNALHQLDKAVTYPHGRKDLADYILLKNMGISDPLRTLSPSRVSQIPEDTRNKIISEYDRRVQKLRDAIPPDIYVNAKEDKTKDTPLSTIFHATTIGGRESSVDNTLENHRKYYPPPKEQRLADILERKKKQEADPLSAEASKLYGSQNTSLGRAGQSEDIDLKADKHFLVRHNSRKRLMDTTPYDPTQKMQEAIDIVFNTPERIAERQKEQEERNKLEAEKNKTNTSEKSTAVTTPTQPLATAISSASNTTPVAAVTTPTQPLATAISSVANTTPVAASNAPSFLQSNKGKLGLALALLGGSGALAYAYHNRKQKQKQKQEQAAEAIMAAKNLSEAQRRKLLRNLGIGTGAALGSYGLYRALR